MDEVCRSLQVLCDASEEQFPLTEKIRFFKRTGTAFGRSALMLSGGATLGMFHLGVIKALWQEGVLPRVVSGSSAGSIIAAVVAGQTDDEIEQIFDPEFLYLQAFRSLPLRQMIHNRSFMDSHQLEECLAQNMGEMTFEEGFEKTRRIVDITVSPLERHQQSRLLNYLYSPNVLLSRAVLASCAIPGVFSPVELTAKDYQGQIGPYLPGKQWVDGSLRSDLPMLRLARLHNVNHYIVSQTNPHVVPFMKQKKHRRGLAPFARELMSSSAAAASKHVIQTARDHMPDNTAGLMAEKLHSITNQRYQGDINIFPRHTPKKLLKTLSNPSAADIEQFIADGERLSWPHVEQIRNSSKISRQFESCTEQVKRAARAVNTTESTVSPVWRRFANIPE